MPPQDQHARQTLASIAGDSRDPSRRSSVSSVGSHTPLMRVGQSASHETRVASFQPPTHAPVHQPGHPQLPVLSPIAESMQSYGHSPHPNPQHGQPADGYYDESGTWYPPAPPPFAPFMHQNTPHPFTYAPIGGSGYNGAQNPMMGAAMQAPPLISLTQEALNQLLATAVKAAAAGLADYRSGHSSDSSGKPKPQTVSAVDFPLKLNGHNITARVLETWAWTTKRVYSSKGWTEGPEYDKYTVSTLHLALEGNAREWFVGESKQEKIVPGTHSLEDVMQMIDAHFMPLPTDTETWHEYSKKFGHGTFSNPSLLVNTFMQYATKVKLTDGQLVEDLINSLRADRPDARSQSLSDKCLETLSTEQAKLRAMNQPPLTLHLACRLIQSFVVSFGKPTPSDHAHAGRAVGNHRHYGQERSNAGSSRVAQTTDNRPNDPMELGAIDGQFAQTCSLLSKHLNLSEDVIRKRKEDNKCIYCGEAYSQEHFKTCAKKQEFRAQHPRDSGKGSRGGKKSTPRKNHRQ